jgi:rubrerythrin
MNMQRVHDLLLLSLEHEQGGVKVYETALSCTNNRELSAHWEQYLNQTLSHVTDLESICLALGLDPQRETPGRAVVRHLGAALVEAMKMAFSSGDLAGAELVACECVVLAETKDHLDWTLIGKCAEHLPPAEAQALRKAFARIEDQEDEHLYHTKGWCRELWVRALGMNAVLPPPEEIQGVKTAVGAARAEQAAERTR